MAVVGWWRETAAGVKDAKEPDWDIIFSTPEERKARMRSLIAEQARRRLEFNRRGPGLVVESTFKKKNG